MHFLTPARFRVYLIIAGSTVFYAWWRIDYIWLPYALTLLTWVGVRWIVSADNAEARKRRLIATLLAVFAPLVLVKYGYFITHDVVGGVVDLDATEVDPDFFRWALPLGISFITFTLTAYIIDVYREHYAPEKRLSTLLAYVLFFPHLVAGPILRPHELMPQLKQLRKALDARFLLGLSIFTLGLVKKLVFADQIAVAVDPVFAPGAQVTGWEYILGIYGFSVQIYCDFSGYTDMAIGLAYILRVRLPTNFLRPYSSESIIEFWRRWHITLSHWLRDYLYIFALGGNRKGRVKQLNNLFITMVLGGLWHGANWTFVVWGALHGIALAINHVFKGTFRLPKMLAVFLTFNFVTFAWIYFRAPDIATAHSVMAGPFVSEWGALDLFAQANAFSLMLIGVFLLTHRWDRHARIRWAVQHVRKIYIWPAILFFWVVAISVSQGSSAKFIYFDF